MLNFKDRLAAVREPQDAADAELYRNSELVLMWLVLFDISKMNVELPVLFHDVLGIAFDRASNALRNGQLSLDYAPHSPQVFEMPEPRHPMYMQALLYWSTKFDCRPAILADAYAQLGRAAPVSSGYIVVSNLKDDYADRRAPARVGASTLGPRDQPSTLPMFVATVPA